MREVIDKYAAMPFSYGTDCCQFAADVVEYFTGSNPIAELSYTDERSAYRLIRGFGGMGAALRHYLGEPYAGHKDGDVCLIDANDGREAVAVIYRNRVVARVEGGLMDYPLDRAKYVWCT